MKILHVLHYSWPFFDGYVARTLGMVTAQRKMLGHRIQMAVSPYAPHTRARDPSIVAEGWGREQQTYAAPLDADSEPISKRRWELPEIRLNPLTERSFSRSLRDLARTSKPDLIHAHHPHFVGRPARQAAAELGVPLVYEIRCFNGDFFMDRKRPEIRSAGHLFNHFEYSEARRASAVITIGQALRDRLLKHRCVPERTFVVRNSVNTDHFFPMERPGERNGDFHAGYATTFDQIENLEAAVEAACAVHRKLSVRGRNFELTLAGTGKEWPRIKELVDARGAGDFIHLPGFISYESMPAFYRSLDLFVIPRKAAHVARSTTPLKPLEALACGLPLLCTALPAMRELLAGRNDVRFVEPDAAGLSRGLLEFADHPWAGHGGLEERSWAREIRVLEEVYEKAREYPQGLTNPTA